MIIALCVFFSIQSAFRMSIVIETSLPFPGMGLTASGGEGPFAITSKIVKRVAAEQTRFCLFQ